MARYRDGLNEVETYEQDKVDNMIDEIENRVIDIKNILESIVWEDILDYKEEIENAITELDDLSRDLY